MKFRISILAVVSLFVLTGVAFARDEAEFESTTETIPCPEGILTGFSEIEGETVQCGTVTVPVNYDEPDGTTIDLVYAMLKSRSQAPATDPVIYLHGGPGVGELNALTQGVSDRFETLRQRRDVIIFDQRGVGYSFGEIDCKAIYDEEYDAAYDTAVNQLGPEAPLYAPGFVAAQAVYGHCAGALTDQDVDLTQYNTLNNARDVVTLAAALGHDSYNLYGISYGTRLGLEVLRQNPADLRALVIDSVLPPEIRFNDQMPVANDESFQNIYAMCLADDACAEAYPHLIERLNALFKKLDEAPISLDYGAVIDSEALATLLTVQPNLTVGVYMVPYLPRLIHELEQGVTDTWEALTFTASLFPQETTDRFPSPDGDIPFSARALLNNANDVARQSAQLDQAATDIANQAIEIIGEDSISPAGRFFNTVDERWESPFSAVQELDFRTDYLALPSQEPVAATLEAFVNKHFSGADAEILLALIAELSAEEIELLFENAHFNSRFHDLANGIAHYLYFCNDDVPFNSLAGLRENEKNYRIPGLTLFEADKQALFFEGCENLPTGTLPDSIHQPVSGDGSIPVLVFAGANDTQAATSWARQAADELIGAQYVEFPNAGHGAIDFSQCAKDIAAAFVDYPEKEVNSSCTADLVPRFSLPDEPLGTN